MTIGFIGAGNMGGALAAAVAKSGESLLIADRDTAKAAALAETLGAATADNARVAAESDYIFLGVKPQVLPALLEELKPVLAARKAAPVLVSMAAGFATQRITAGLGAAYPLIRIMPNTPAMVGEGMILYTAVNSTTEAQTAAFCRCMAGAGRLCCLPEGLIDAGCAVSGCGPAYVYLFIEALADGGVECGLPRALAQELAAQTVLGSAKMVLETGSHPGVLKDAVCSPGGTTIAGVHALEQGGFRGTAMEAVLAAYRKTLAMGQ